MSAAESPFTIVSLLTKLSVVPGRNFSGQIIVGEVGADVMMVLKVLMRQNCQCDLIAWVLWMKEEKDDDDMQRSRTAAAAPKLYTLSHGHNFAASCSIFCFFI